MKRLLFLSSALCFLSWPLWAYIPGKFYSDGSCVKDSKGKCTTLIDLKTEKVIALTFDDGPGHTTPAILELLKQHHIHATFFMEGSQVEGYPAIVRQVLAEGHEIGNHTYTHFDFHKAKNAMPARLVHELEQTEAALQRAAGVHTQVVRMPYGYYNRSWLLPTLKEHGYALVHWSFGTDWILSKPADQMAKEYIAHAKPGAVFLFHDGGRHREKTLDALTTVINTLEQQGYHFIPARDMFKE